jgi:hypothetical protein
MKPRTEDLQRLKEALVHAYNQQELIDLAEKIEFPHQQEIAPGALSQEVYAFVQAILRRGRLPELLRIVKTERPDNQELGAVVAHLEECTNLTFESRMTLQNLLTPGSVPEEAVHTFYLASRPSAVALREVPKEAFDAAIRLAGIPELGNTPAEKFPVLPFVERVAFFWDDGDPGPAEALREWSEREARSHGLSLPESDAIRKDAQTNQPPSSHLLIQFHPAGGRYRLGAYLWTDPGKPPRPIDCDERPRALAELSAAVEPIVKKARDIDVNSVLEFCVPLDLLNLPFETWKVMQRRFSSSLGTLSPVVIRLYDRVHGEDLQEQQLWRYKWARAKNLIRPDVHWIDDMASDANVLFGILSQPESPPYVALGFAHACVRVADAVEAALAAGSPVLFWIRDPDAEGSVIRQEIESILNGDRELTILPHLVRRYRTNPPSLHRDHFTLFYDSPDRLPPRPRPLGISTIR